MTVVVSRGYVWIAEDDRIAHAHASRGHVTRTLCGRPALDARWAKPAATRCSRCEEVASGQR